MTNPGFLQALMKWSASHQDKGPSEVLEPLDPERAAFLQAAIDSLSVDVVQQVKDLLENASNTENSVDARLEALEGVQDIVEQIDNAKDLHTIGGYVVILDLLKDKETAVRCQAAEIVATVMQNNPACQAFALDTNTLSKVSSMCSKDEPAEVWVKGVRALSAVVRGFPATRQAFVQHDGIPRLMEGYDLQDDRLNAKISFLLRSLAIEDNALIAMYKELNLQDKLGEAMSEDSSDTVYELIVGLLATLYPSDGSDHIPTAVAEKLKTRQSMIVAKSKEDQESHEEERAAISQLLKE